MNARDAVLFELRAVARAHFRKFPQHWSMLLAAAQYWCDEAADAVHAGLYVSERELPLWPHRCAYSTWQDDLAPVAGEACGRCGRYRYDLQHWDDNSDELIAAFAPYCHEAGNQEQANVDNYLPVAVARRCGDDAEVEIIGRVARPQSYPYEPVGERDPTWDDPRARELLALVAATPSDDEPRRVLADYLLERNDPRGEYIALCLEREPTTEMMGRRDELFAEHRARWLHPLQRIACGTRWSRGFLAGVEVFGDAPVHGVAWWTVETLFVHEGTRNLLVPDMRALRTLTGFIDEDWTRALATADAPSAIETLEVLGVDDALCALTTVPMLRHLIVRDFDARLLRAPWWSQLERVTIVGNAPADWFQRHRELGVRSLAIVSEATDPARERGWEIAIDSDGGCEIAMRGFSPYNTLDALAALLPALPATSITLVASEHYVPARVDIEYLQRATAAPITAR